MNTQDTGLILDRNKIDLIKNTICKGSSDEELQIFIHACQRTGLDPLMKQIHAVKRPERQKDGTYKDSMTIQTGIDGFRLIAERTGRYAPGREPTYSYDKNGKLLSATAYVKKQTKDGTWHEVSATAFYTEYCQTTKDGKPTKFWANMPHGQLAKCAEALALRKAFPAELSGVYSKEEMEQSENISMNEPIKLVQKPEIITKEQADELVCLLSDCDPKYQESVWNTLRKQPINIDTIDQLPANLYERIKLAVTKNRDQYQQYLLQQAEITSEEEYENQEAL